MNWTSTVKQYEDSEDLYVELPEDLLDQLGWEEGDTLEWHGNHDTVYIVKKYIKNDIPME